ncbi:MAG: T9SS type A sorting domain-containing protein [Calditrichaeota bacterium]|nr:T9SS type A sorting domain-containing protein [Calditrichota bacterium]
MRLKVLVKILSIALFFAYGLQLSAQTDNLFGLKKATETAVLEESFEGSSFPPTGWKTISNSPITEAWRQSSKEARTGSYSAACEPQYFSMDDWLITKAVDLSGVSSAKLYFYETGNDWNSSGQHHYIKVSTTSQTNTSSFTTVLDMTPSNHDIEGFYGQPVIVDLTDFVGNSTVYIAFHFVGSDDWYIDDVKVTTPQDHDVMAYSLNINSHYEPNTTFTPTGTVQNVGLNTESFDVHFGYYDWEENPIILDTKSVSNLAPNAQADVTFNDYTIGNIECDFFIMTDLSTDMDASNNVATKRVNSFFNTKEMVLAEKFTGTWCQYCPGAARALDSLYHAHPESLAPIDYHIDDDFEIPDGQARDDYYGIGGYPTAIFNGTHRRVGGASYDSDWIPIYNDYEAIYQDCKQELTPFHLELSFTENGSTIIGDLNTTYLTPSYYKYYKLFYVLTESHIAYNWQTEMDSLQFVARAMYPDANGKTFYEGATFPSENMVVNDTVHFTIPSGVVKENCDLIAFIQDTRSKEVMGADKVNLGNPPSALEENGENLVADAFQLKQNYPNPFNPSTTISYYLPQSAPVVLTVFDNQGKKIQTLVQKTETRGWHQINFGADGLASGVYYYRLETPKFSKTQKMLLLK